MHKLLQRQLAKATPAPGKVDIDLLAGLVDAAYEEADRDRRRVDRTIALMSDELQQTHRRLLEAFDIVPEGLVLLDADGRYVLFNQRFLELYDTARDKIEVGASFIDSVRAGVERGHYLEAIGREEEWLADRLRVHIDGHGVAEQHLRGDRWVRIDERRTADGGSIGVRIDITDLKRREAALRERSEQLVEAHRMGKIGDWSLGLTADEYWWSPQLYELLRYDPATFRPTRAAVRSICVDSEADSVVRAREEMLKHGKAHTIDMKVVRGDGSRGDFAVVTKAAFDPQGRMIGFAGTIQDISERKRAEEQLEKLAYYDPLTGLANRVLFQRELGNVLTRSRKGARAALLLLDLDRFKDVNDSLGHASGDELLSKVARRISRVLGPNQVFCRLGGDEFAILAEQCGDRTEIEHLANRVVDAVTGSILLERGEATVGTSIGIARIPADGANPTDLLRNADLALYHAKERGRGCYRFFDSKLSAAARRKLALARELRRAVNDERGLEVHYQPQVSLVSGRVIGFEALARWTHHEFGSVPPSQFIPIAEASRLICDLGILVLRRAAIQAKAWLDAGEPLREMSVNVSAAQIWQSDFVAEVAEVLRETGLPPHVLCLELTESLLADNAEGRVRSVLTDLKRLGISLALDDFGTDYSSLGSLNQLPFDSIKIDKIFLKDVETSDRRRSCSRASSPFAADWV